jgi:protocatechuate 3,4-dioxygenase beta subunit
MKMILFLLMLLVAIIGAGQYVNKNPIKFGASTPSVSPKSELKDNASSPPTTCSKNPIKTVTEGPYYKEGSPERKNIREGYNTGTPITLAGYVMDSNCNPIAGAWVDFWQANEKGEYDNNGFTLRGHQYTDVDGKYALQTIIPGEYPGRTPHIHVKIRPTNNSQVVTTQLFIPGNTKNQADTLYDQSLLMDANDGTNGKTATYNFVVDVQ